MCVSIGQIIAFDKFVFIRIFSPLTFSNLNAKTRKRLFIYFVLVFVVVAAVVVVVVTQPAAAHTVRLFQSSKLYWNWIALRCGTAWEKSVCPYHRLSVCLIKVGKKKTEFGSRLWRRRLRRHYFDAQQVQVIIINMYSASSIAYRYCLDASTGWGMSMTRPLPSWWVIIVMILLCVCSNNCHSKWFVLA